MGRLELPRACERWNSAETNSAVALLAAERHPAEGEGAHPLHGTEPGLILMSMKVGARGRATIPKEIREQFGLGPETEVEFRVVGGSIVLKKAPKKLNLAKWKGRCAGTFAKLGYSSVDKFIADVRGR